MDPKLKRWETGLVCDNCKRKAVALTLVKSGDVWDRTFWSRRLLGKKLCYRCMSGSIMRIQYLESLESGWSVFIGGLLFIASMAGFIIVWVLKAELTIPIILFLVFIVFLFASRAGKRGRDRRRPSDLKKPMPLMINTEWFFHGSEENRWEVTRERTEEASMSPASQ